MKVSQLVSVDAETGKLAVGKEAVEYLSSLSGRVGLTSIAGNYRTGKSWMLNQLCDVPAGANKGFGVGSTVQRHTLGLWIAQHTRTYTDPTDGQPFKMLFMDMEGLSATQATEQHDVRMFALGLLLSSFFVYNSRGAIDEEAISKLAKVADISQHIRMAAAADDANDDAGSDTAESTSSSSSNTPKKQQALDGAGSAMPEFMWLLRDFSLELKNEGGQLMSPDQYLEQTLAEGHVDEDKRAMRERLRSLLPKRHAAVLPRPADDEAQLQNLHHLPPSKYRPVFRERLKTLRATLDANSHAKKTPQGSSVSGAMLARFVQVLVDAFNEGKTPVIRNSWAQMSDLECRTATESAAVEWAQLDQHLKTAVSAQQLDKLIADTRARSLAVFGAATQSVGNAQEIARYLRKLEDAMDRQERHYRQHNAGNVSTQLRSLLDGHEATLAASENIQTLRNHLQVVEAAVHTQFGKSPDIERAYAGLVLVRVWTWLLASSGRVSSRLEMVSASYEELKVQHAALVKEMAACQIELGTLGALKKAYDENQHQLNETRHELAGMKDAHAALGLELQALQQQYETQTAQSTEALVKATEAANDRVAAADEARSASLLELESTHHQLEGETRRAANATEELGEANARLEAIEADVASLHECRLRLREAEDQVVSLQRNHDELQQHMQAKLHSIQQTADASIANATRQAQDRAERADSELQQKAQELQQAQQQVERERAEWVEKIAKEKSTAQKWSLAAQKCKTDSEATSAKYQQLQASAKDQETLLKAKEAEARTQLNEAREQHRLEAGKEREQWTQKMQVAEAARNKAIQDQLAQQMAASEKDREKSSRLAVAESRLGELKRVRQECDTLEQDRKRLRTDLETSQRAQNRAAGERDALQRSQDRQQQELAQARDQIGHLQRAATDKQFQHATDLFNARAQTGGSGGGGGATSSAAAANQ